MLSTNDDIVCEVNSLCIIGLFKTQTSWPDQLVDEKFHWLLNKQDSERYTIYNWKHDLFRRENSKDMQTANLTLLFTCYFLLCYSI